MNKKWTMREAAIWGGVIGFVISIVGPLLTGGRLPLDTVELIGNLAAGIIIGAIVGVIVALIRNAVVKAS